MSIVCLPVKYVLPDTDDMSHLMQYNAFERARRLQYGDVVDVKAHLAGEADSRARLPDPGGSSRSQYSIDAINGCQFCGDKKLTGWVVDRSSTRHVRDHFSPPLIPSRRVGGSANEGGSGREDTLVPRPQPKVAVNILAFPHFLGVAEVSEGPTEVSLLNKFIRRSRPLLFKQAFQFTLSNIDSRTWQRVRHPPIYTCRPVITIVEHAP